MQKPSQDHHLPSDQVVSYTIQQGFQHGVILTTVGLTIGGLASIVLARGGGAARKVITGFTGGVGLGSAWTQCSIELEEVLRRK